MLPGNAELLFGRKEMRANVRKASEMKEARCAIIRLGIVLCGLSMLREAFMGQELCAYALTVLHFDIFDIEPCLHS